MNILGAILILLSLAGCAGYYNPGGGGYFGGHDNTDWGALSQEVGKQIRHK